MMKKLTLIDSKISAFNLSDLLICNFGIFRHCELSLLQCIFQLFGLKLELFLGLREVSGEIFFLQFHRLAKLFDLLHTRRFL